MLENVIKLQKSARPILGLLPYLMKSEATIKHPSAASEPEIINVTEFVTIP